MEPLFSVIGKVNQYKVRGSCQIRQEPLTLFSSRKGDDHSSMPTLSAN